jgi:hypothetical protein
MAEQEERRGITPESHGSSSRLMTITKQKVWLVMAVQHQWARGRDEWLV